jgi:predicted  nucleic acid-binding Zn-ribbon protein
LGEAAAMYTSNVSPKNPTKEKSAMTVEVPESLWDQIVARFNLGSGQNPDPTPEPEPVDVTADPAFIELKAERDKFEAEAKEAQDKEQAEKLAAEIRTEFEDKDFGTAFIELGQAEESAQQLSTMTPEQRDWVMRNFKALSKQIEEAALGEKGDDGINTNTEEHAFDAEIKSIMEDKGIAYHEAFTVAQQLKPDLFTAYVEQRNKDGK